MKFYWKGRGNVNLPTCDLFWIPNQGKGFRKRFTVQLINVNVLEEADSVQCSILLEVFPLRQFQNLKIELIN